MDGSELRTSGFRFLVTWGRDRRNERTGHLGCHHRCGCEPFPRTSPVHFGHAVLEDGDRSRCQHRLERGLSRRLAGGPAVPVYRRRTVLRRRREFRLHWRSRTPLRVSAPYVAHQNPAVTVSGSGIEVLWSADPNGSSTQFDLWSSAWDGTSFGSATAYTSAVATERNPAAAGNTNGHLVVWEDTRGAATDLYASLSGGAEVAVATGAARSESPAVASDGTDYLAVFADDRDGNWNIYGTVVDGSSAVVQQPTALPFRRRAGTRSCRRSRLMARTTLWSGKTGGAPTRISMARESLLMAHSWMRLPRASRCVGRRPTSDRRL